MSSLYAILATSRSFVRALRLAQYPQLLASASGRPRPVCTGPTLPSLAPGHALSSHPSSLLKTQANAALRQLIRLCTTTADTCTLCTIRACESLKAAAGQSASIPIPISCTFFTVRQAFFQLLELPPAPPLSRLSFRHLTTSPRAPSADTSLPLNKHTVRDPPTLAPIYHQPHAGRLILILILIPLTSSGRTGNGGSRANPLYFSGASMAYGTALEYRHTTRTSRPPPLIHELPLIMTPNAATEFHLTARMLLLLPCSTFALQHTSVKSVAALPLA
ncbi:hypothetical protein B0H13DRAFT_2389514 [Mycena leptocephala]|nr:hypothetical protein B0H13DRAFT_2389514 [Mycena leptocephala]